jgi:hypothetical protein
MLSGALLDEPALFVVPSPSCEDALSTPEVTHNLVFHDTLLALAGGGIGGAEAAVGGAVEEGQARMPLAPTYFFRRFFLFGFTAFSRSARGGRSSLTSSEVTPPPSVTPAAWSFRRSSSGIESQQTA